MDVDQQLRRGQLVKVPLGSRKIPAVVDACGVDVSDVPVNKIKNIDAVLDFPHLPDELLEFIKWVADYTLSPLGLVLKMALSTPGLLEPAPTRQLIRLNASAESPSKITPARQKVLDILSDGAARSKSDIADTAGVSASVISGLVKAGTLVSEQVASDLPHAEPVISDAGPALSDEQQFAVSEIQTLVRKEAFAPVLLDGVTGSGKTEVYFEALVEALKNPEAQILILVPEIALTSQWLKRFEARFGVRPVVWHSDIGNAERRRAWSNILKGNARVVVGARSALFLPFQKFGLIVVDEEHDPSFKQEEGVLYHARDMAVVRAKVADCPIILASATPSLETQVNAAQGRFKLLKLRERFGDAKLPTIVPLDMRKVPPASGKWLSPDFVEQMKRRLEQGEQTMLFLNRRGFAPLTLCRTCGHRFGCVDCSSWLVEHRFRRELICHQCGYTEPKPDQCPSCKDEDSLVPCGPGVERLFEEVSEIFPDARTAVMTSDTMTSPKATAQMVEQIENGRLDIVIGTQILTKGYHFPNLTLVGVVDADLGLRGGDLRAAERTYQQLMQVAGRAGRAEKPGEVYLQTYEPEHPVVDAMVRYDGEGLMALERDIREQYQMPPFGRLVGLIISGPDIKAVAEAGRRLAASAPHAHVLNILGPTPAPLARVRGHYRYRMLVHASKSTAVQGLMREWLSRISEIRGVKIKMDIDPQSFF
jgi:primosomal protein N' (replication factor Y)